MKTFTTVPVSMKSITLPTKPITTVAEARNILANNDFYDLNREVKEAFGVIHRDMIERAMRTIRHNEYLRARLHEDNELDLGTSSKIIHGHIVGSSYKK